MGILPRKCALAPAIALLFAAPVIASAQTFYEPFDISAQVPPQSGCNTSDFPGGPGTFPFPAGWLLRNVDNRTPNIAVGWIAIVDNSAWEVREDWKFDLYNCVAFSTSYYSPPGAADDWAWSPPVALLPGVSVLSWRATNYDQDYRDGYEVRVMASPNVPGGGTGVLGNQVSRSTQVFSTAAENAAWTHRAVDLSTYAGQTVYVGFHNNSNDKFLLLIDDVKIEGPTPNLVAVAAPGFAVDYSHVPDDFPIQISPRVTALNQGGVTLTNISANVTAVLDGVPVDSAPSSNTIASLGIGADAPLVFPVGYLISPGVLTLSYALTAAETPTEIETLDNVIERPGTTTGGNELTRYEGPPTGQLGIGAGNGGELGSQFKLTQTATFEGVRFGFTGHAPPDPPALDPWPDYNIIAKLWAVDGMTGKPSTVMATTVPIHPLVMAATYDVVFATGPRTLAAGTYVVTVSEPVGEGGTLPLALSPDRYKAGTTWANWPTSPSGWAHFEDFGAGLARAPAISLLTYVTLFKDGFEESAAPAQPAFKAAPRPQWPMRRAPIQVLSKVSAAH